MSIKGRYPERTPLYAAFLSIGAVAAIAVFVLVLKLNAVPEAPDSGSQSAQTTPSVSQSQGYTASEEIAEEMKDAAQELVMANYNILTLYYTQGMNHKDEPYGNQPEDGYYTVDSDEYSTLAQLEEYVDSAFVADVANDIKANSLGYGPIYKERSGGELGIIANFTPMPYDITWENPKFKIDPVSDEECIIDVTVHNRVSGEEVNLMEKMIKTEDGWRLKNIIM